MLKNTLNFLWITLFVVLWGCETQKEASTKVYKLKEQQEPVEKGLIYALPETELFFTIRVTRTTEVPGPYHEYGEELLGLSQVPHNLNSYWEIDNIDIEEYSDIDYDHIYVVEPEGKFSIQDKNFTKKGWILPLDKSFKEVSRGDYYHKKDYYDDIYYKDLSVKKFVGKETRTVYKSVWKDSLYAKVPVEESYTLQKNLEQKAREAANFIFMIREKRFELISGMGDYYPDGEAMATAVNEMNSIEERYLTLFTGKKFVDTLEYTIHWSPTQKNLIEPEILFRFSANEGVIKPQTQKGTPVWLEFIKLSDTRKLENYFNSNSALNSGEGRFYYRIPAKSMVQLNFAEKTVAKKYLEIFQYGSVIRIPYVYLNNQKIIEYYIEEE